jgi:hypothetical protein
MDLGLAASVRGILRRVVLRRLNIAHQSYVRRDVRSMPLRFIFRCSAHLAKLSAVCSVNSCRAKRVSDDVLCAKQAHGLLEQARLVRFPSGDHGMIMVVFVGGTNSSASRQRPAL